MASAISCSMARARREPPAIRPRQTERCSGFDPLGYRHIHRRPEISAPGRNETGRGLQFCFKQPPRRRHRRGEIPPAPEFAAVPAAGCGGIRCMIEPGPVDPQPAGRHMRCHDHEVGSQEKSALADLKYPRLIRKPILPDSDWMSLALTKQRQAAVRKTRRRSALESCGGRSTAICSAPLRIFMRARASGSLKEWGASGSIRCS